jgi:hypothetical protein
VFHRLRVPEVAPDAWKAARNAAPKNEIIADLDSQIREIGGDYLDWCVGIARDGREPLFEAHRDEGIADGWLYREAFTSATAQEIKDYFVARRGTHLGPSSRDDARLV